MNQLGFGFLRLPETENKEIDWPLLNQMVDLFLSSGGSYFDTAYTYLEGRSELAFRKSVVERYPRSAYQIADKLPSWYVKKPEDCLQYFREQCVRCGVEWFDVYLLHWLNRENYAIAQQHREFEFLSRLKAEGKARKTGFSYHGDAALLHEILMAHPEVDIIQLQINYLDWESPAMEARKCHDVAVKHGKEVVVMEPVKGGMLANLPEEATLLLNEYHPNNSSASWAIRFAGSQENVSIVLSGMNSMEQMRDNLKERPSLTEEGYHILEQVCGILQRSITVPCTDCRYCVSHCPKKIVIPDYFNIYNEYCRYPEEDWKIEPVYAAVAAAHGRASDCIECRKCEQNCPQKIPVAYWLSKIADVMEA